MLPPYFGRASGKVPPRPILVLINYISGEAGPKGHAGSPEAI
jgi:hypothetical protein